MLEESGLVFLQAFDEYSNQEPRTDSGAIVVVAQEKWKRETGGNGMSDYI